MRSWGGLLAGAIGLAVLDAVVSRPSSASNVGGFLEGAGNLVRRFLDPTIPFFSTTTTSTTTSSTTASPAAAATTAAVETAVPLYI